jgi:hypothetical protein
MILRLFNFNIFNNLYIYYKLTVKANQYRTLKILKIRMVGTEIYKYSSLYT